MKTTKESKMALQAQMRILKRNLETRDQQQQMDRDPRTRKTNLIMKSNNFKTS